MGRISARYSHNTYTCTAVFTVTVVVVVVVVVWMTFLFITGKPLDGPLPLINITKETPAIDKSTTTTMEKRPKSTQSITSTRDARVKRPITSKFRKDDNGNHSAAFVAKIIVT